MVGNKLSNSSSLSKHQLLHALNDLRVWEEMCALTEFHRISNAHIEEGKLW